MQKVLLVDDSKEIFRMVETALCRSAELFWAKNLEEARKTLSSNPVDLVLLDIGLPDGKGFELCNDILNLYPQAGIFFLTAESDLSQKALGFASGADDYIVKPFDPMELKIRVEGKLKKNTFREKEVEVIRTGNLSIDHKRQEVTLLGDQPTPISLTALEFKILSYFVDRVEEVIPRDQILNDIWGQEVHVYPRSVDTHVSKLRRKLLSEKSRIQSVRGSGYRFLSQAPEGAPTQG